MPVGLSYCYCTQRIPRAYPKGQAFMSSTSPQYGNDSISQLKGADRVRKRPGVIFGSDGLDGCEHAVFEILSNAIDEAREGYGNLITLTYFKDKSIEVSDFGRGCPLDWNPNEKRYNWELVFCELYAGGKYKNDAGGDYEFSLGLNGLGSCATQYASEYMDVTVWRDGNKYSLHFKKGEVVGKKGKELTTEPADRKKTGTTIRWRPDVEVFTDIDIPEEYFDDMLHRQAVVNAGVTFRLRIEKDTGFETRDYCYENGIVDYVKELAGGAAFTEPEFISAERKGRDREDKGDYKVQDIRGVLLLEQDERPGILPQLLLAGKRRRAGQGREARLHLGNRRVYKAVGQVPEERVRDKVPGRAGLPDTCDKLLLDADLIREPDEKSDKQPLHPRPR